MPVDLTNLPSDPDILHQIISTLNVENRSLLSEKESLQSEVELLKKQLKLLKAKRFGKSSEKLDKQIAQLELWIEESEIKDADAAYKPDAENDKKSDHKNANQSVINYQSIYLGKK